MLAQFAFSWIVVPLCKGEIELQEFFRPAREYLLS
jgi:hypothetical protein